MAGEELSKNSTGSSSSSRNNNNNYLKRRKNHNSRTSSVILPDSIRTNWTHHIYRPWMVYIQRIQIWIDHRQIPFLSSSSTNNKNNCATCSKTSSSSSKQKQQSSTMTIEMFVCRLVMAIGLFILFIHQLGVIKRRIVRPILRQMHLDIIVFGTKNMLQRSVQEIPMISIPIPYDPIYDDNISIGKTCFYTIPYDILTCRDCSSTSTTTGSISSSSSFSSSSPSSSSSLVSCRIVSPVNNDCGPSFPRQSWDIPPRSRTFMNSRSSNSIDTPLRLINTWFDQKYEYERYPCPSITSTTLASNPCFNLNKCRTYPLKIYFYTSTTWKHHSPSRQVMIIEELPFTTITLNPTEACLLIVAPLDDNIVLNYTNLTSMSFWNAGQNHYIFDAHLSFGSHADNSIHKVNYNRAALASPSLTWPHLRMGYDTILTQPMNVQIPFNPNIHRSRLYLLSFRGAVYDWLLPYCQHRYIARTYWSTSSLLQQKNISISNLATCPGQKASGPTNKQTQAEYIQEMSDSTFVFCPGGGGAYSYRFTEALAAGAIPVITTDMVTPFYPEMDWTQCVYKVSEARIIDLPRLLSEIPLNDIEQRQIHCRAMFELVVADGTSGFIFHGQRFKNAMEIWYLRIRTAIQREEIFHSLNYATPPLSSSSTTTTTTTSKSSLSNKQRHRLIQECYTKGRNWPEYYDECIYKAFNGTGPILWPGDLSNKNNKKK